MTSPDTSQTMPAVAFTEALPIEDERSLVDVELPRPTAGPHDLVVEVRAVSVNPVDTKVRSGDQDEPRVLGYDASGVVVEVGSEVTLHAVGDEVWYAGDVSRPGTNAAYHAVDERLVGRKPTTLSHVEAAALPLTAITAWEGLFERLRIDETAGGTLLVVGATGGVGSMVLQLAESLLPQVRVVATASDDDKRAWCTRLGAEACVDHRSDVDLRDQIAQAAPDGVDWVFTSQVEREGQLELYVDVLNPFGAILAIDDPETLDVVPLKSKSLSLHWELMFTRALTGGEQQRSQHDLLERVASLVDEGRVVTTATTTLAPIDAAQLRRAHAMVEAGGVVGKVVLTAEDLDG